MSGERFYRALLRLLPPRLRREHGAELLEAFQERRREARRGRRGAGWLWGFLLSDLWRAAAAAWLWELRGGGAPPAGAHARRGRALPLATIAQDLRFAFRSFRRRPGFVLVATLTLGLGTGATTAIWSVVHGVLFAPLPYPDPDRLVQLGTLFRDDGGSFGQRLGPLSPGDVLDLRGTSTTLQAAAASRLETRVLGGGGEPEQLIAAGVSASWFEVLGRAPARGRPFTTEEDTPEGQPVAVLSDGFWQRRFGADPGVLGGTLLLDGVPFTVVGIMGREFHPPEAIFHEDVEAWYPLARVGDALDDRGSFFVQGIARLRPGVTLEASAEELAAIGERISAANPDTPERRLALAPLHERTVGDAGRTLWVLLGAVGLLLLMACANVAGLFLVRATEREREMAVRTAVGATRGRVVAQLLTEGLLLALAGGALAVGLAHAGVAGLRRWSPGGIPRMGEVGVDGGVLAFAFVVSAATGLAFSAAPAARALKQAAAPLRDPTAVARRDRARARGALVVVQTALALVLLVAAGLLASSFVRLQRVDPGFDPSGVAWLRVYLPGDAYPPEARAAFQGEVLARVRALPGVRAAGGMDNLPLSPNRSLSFVSPAGLVLGPDEDPPAVSWHSVLPGTFEALGTPVLRGRAFSDRDDGTGPLVAVVNEAAAELLWPGADPVGRTYVPGRPDGGGDPVTVVGLVADVRHRGLATPPEPEIYLPALAIPRVLMNLLVRTDPDPASLLGPLRQAVWDVDPSLPLPEYGTLSAHAAGSILEPRFHALLLSAFAAASLGLALLGVYGTLAYTVELRAHELGVRMALGARRREVVALVVRRGMTLVGAGLVLGVALSQASAGALERFVFGVGARDPVTLAVAVLAMAGLALLACVLPAVRAARLDPVAQLRPE